MLNPVVLLQRLSSVFVPSSFIGNIAPAESTGLQSDGPVNIGLEFWVTEACSLDKMMWYRKGILLTHQTILYGLYEVGGSAPTVSGSLTVGLSVEASSTHSSSYAATRAVDGDGATYWLGFTASMPQSLSVHLSAATVLTSYTMKGHPSNGAYSPKDWTFEGSNDGSSWTTLDTRTGETMGTSEHTYTFTNSTSYQWYRVLISANNGGATYVGVATLSFDGITATGWEEVPLTHTLTADQHYRAVLNFPKQRSNDGPHASTDTVVSGPLNIPLINNSTYAYGATLVNPVSYGSSHANHGIDVQVSVF